MDFILAKGETTTAQRAIGSMNPQRIITKYEVYYYNPKTKKKVRQGSMSPQELAIFKKDAKKKGWKVISSPTYKTVYNAKNMPSTAAGTVTTGADYSMLPKFNSIDIECGNNNDFEIKLNRDRFNDLGVDFGDYIYTPGEEYGGRIELVDVNTNSDEITIQGTTWRGLLEQAILAPDVGSNYYTASGDLRDVTAGILARAGDAGAIFTVPATATGVTVSGYRFNRYVTKLAAIEKLLGENDYKLKIWTESNKPGGFFSVYAQPVPVQDLSSTIDYTQETTEENINIKDDHGGITHLICLGSGELALRQRVDLYVSTDGSIIESSGDSYTGVAEKVAVYDDRNVSGSDAAAKLAQLKKDGIAKLKELQSTKTMTLKSGNESALIGDLVGGTDITTGITLIMPVISKIYKNDGTNETIEIDVGYYEEAQDENH